MNTVLSILLSSQIALSTIFAQATLQLTVNIAKDVYLVAEPVEMGVEISNSGTSTVQGNFNGSLIVRLFDENGKEIYPTRPSGNYFSPDVSEIPAGEDHYQIINLSSSFGERYAMLSVEGALRPGKYSVRVNFGFPGNTPQSRVISFEVKMPNGEEVSVYNTYLEILRGTPQGKYPGHLANDALLSILDDHPATVYGPVILTYLMANYMQWQKNAIKSYEIKKRLGETYPWSSRARGSIDMILSEMQSDSQRIEYLKELMVKAEGTPMRKFIERKLQRFAGK